MKRVLASNIILNFKQQQKKQLEYKFLQEVGSCELEAAI